MWPKETAPRLVLVRVSVAGGGDERRVTLSVPAWSKRRSFRYDWQLGVCNEQARRELESAGIPVVAYLSDHYEKGDTSFAVARPSSSEPFDASPFAKFFRIS